MMASNNRRKAAAPVPNIIWTFAIIFLLPFLPTAKAKGNGLEGPSFVHMPSDVVEFSNSTGARIQCSGKGYPQPTIKWLMADGSPVVSIKGLRRVHEDNSLVLSPFKAEDFRQDVHATAYKCSLSNALGTIVSNDVHVKAVTAQPFDLFVYDVYVMKGNTAVLKCHVPNFLTDYITVTAWIRDGAFTIQADDIEKDGKYAILPSGELLVRQVSTSDGQTSYKCKAKHRLTGESKTSVSVGKLFVTEPAANVPPKILTHLPTILAEEGETVVLPCVANGQPVPEIRWSFSSEGNLSPVPHNPRFVTVHGALIIKEVHSADSGLYICESVNRAGGDKTETILTVAGPLSAIMKPPKLVVDMGQAASLSCEITGYPVKKVLWLKDGSSILPDGVKTGKTNTVLQISSVNLSHKGMYQCIALNEQDSVQASAELRMGDTPPEISSAFREQFLQPSTSLSLSCKANGTPLPLIIWSLDDTQIGKENIQYETIDEGTALSTLRINPVRVEDGGVYSCVAKNKAGTASHVARINVYGKLSSRARPKSIVVSGETVWVNCPVYGAPIDSISWEKGDETLPANLQQTVLRNGTLRLQNVQRSRDSGRYTCLARNTKGESTKATVDLVVMVPPKIFPFSFQEELVHQGSRARVQCVVSDGDPPLAIHWLKDGQPIAPNSGIAVRELDEFSSILSIASVSPRHNGNYTCTATNEAASTSHSARLAVNVPPHWVTKPQDSFALLGDDIILDCLADGFPKPTVQWMKARGNDPNAERDLIMTNGRTHILTNGSLQIRRVSEATEGYYFCLASNGIGDGLSKAIYVKIHGPARFLVKFRNETAVVAKEAKLVCEASGDLPINFTWSVNDKAIDMHRKQRFRIRSKENVTEDSALSELIISKVNRNDSKTYTCTAQNPYGSDTLKITLSVLEPPDVPTIIDIQPAGNGTVVVHWKSNFDGNTPIRRLLLQHKEQKSDWGHATNVSLGSANGTTLLRGMRPHTMHVARLRAINDIGSSGFSVEHTFKTDEEIPSASPQHVEVEPVDKQSLRITWQPPVRDHWNGVIRGYNLGYRKATESRMNYTWSNIEIPEDYTEELIYQLSDLQMYTQYSIVVQAYNTKGAGPSSDPFLVMTSEDVPNHAPENVRCSSLSTQTVYVLWDPLSPEKANGILRGYKVFYKPADDWYDLGTNYKVTEYPKFTLQNLEVNTNYSIQVLAFTKVGDGVKSKPIFCKTHEDVPSAPGDIKVLPASVDTVLVAWKPPMKPNGAVTKYNLYVRPIDDDEEIGPETRYSKDAVVRNENVDDTNIHTSREDLVYEISSLEKGRRYEFWVTAVSVVGEGPRSRVMATETASDKVAAQSASFDEVIKTPWKRDLSLPCRGVGSPPPQKIWLKGGKPIRNQDRVKAGADGALIIKTLEMEDGGNYTCTLRNAFGNDEVNYALIVLVPPSAPIVGVYSKTMNSLQLKWQPGPSGGDPIRGYLLFYKKEDGEWVKKDVISDHDSYILENLACGATYQLYMEALNNVGVGDPSDIITITTEGDALEPPPKDQLIREGATFLSLHLDSWPAHGCPIQHFSAEYRRTDETGWTMAHKEVKPSQKRIVIPGLVPGTWYHVRVTAHSSGGETPAEYVCATLGLNGESVQDVTHREERIIWLSLDWILILVSVILAVILVVIITVTLFCLRRRHTNVKRPLARKPMHASVESFVHLQGTNPANTRVYASLARGTMRSDVDPNPYATSTLPGCSPSKSRGPPPPGPRFSIPPPNVRGDIRMDPSRPLSDMEGNYPPLSPAWTVYTNDSAPPKALAKGSSGQNIDVKDIQSRPLPPTPQRVGQTPKKSKTSQETAFSLPSGEPSSDNARASRRLTTFGKPVE